MFFLDNESDTSAPHLEKSSGSPDATPAEREETASMTPSTSKVRRQKQNTGNFK